jgi:hypothetical protein
MQTEVAWVLQIARKGALAHSGDFLWLSINRQ